jgi:hypothetical protein
MKYAEPEDLDFAILLLRNARDKLNNTESEYAKVKVVPRINRVIFELQDLLEQEKSSLSIFDAYGVKVGE